MTARNFFSKLEIKRIVAAIQEAEKDTSGEIRVHIDNFCKGDAIERATEVFFKLKMNETALRNGVLIYLAVKDHKFAIIGDEGINNVVENDFWEDIKNDMTQSFRNNLFTDGIIYGVLRCGKKLKAYFPHQENDIDELSNEISFE
ncbi:MAG TPA: TPM domain-containing protein [Bacteroidetes bacterium]|nr:TPM domain-containing protein [Candidatus Limimorpha avicola]